jgi:hypothetical protein
MARVLLYISTPPFWEGLSAPVDLTTYPNSLSIIVRNALDRASSLFTALVCLDETRLQTISRHKRSEDINRGVF